MPDDDVQAASHCLNLLLRARVHPRDLRHADLDWRADGQEHPQVLGAVRVRQPHRDHGDGLLGRAEAHVQEDVEFHQERRDGHVPRIARIGTRAGFATRRGLRRAPHARRGALLRGLVQRVVRAEGAVVRRAVLQEHAVQPLPRGIGSGAVEFADGLMSKFMVLWLVLFSVNYGARRLFGGGGRGLRALELMKNLTIDGANQQLF